jgi:hypothetical protein
MAMAMSPKSAAEKAEVATRTASTNDEGMSHPQFITPDAGESPQNG